LLSMVVSYPRGRSMFKILILVALLSACTANIIPQTVKQAQTSSYAQLISVTQEVYTACSEKLLSKDTCITMYNNIEAAKVIVDSGESADIILSAIKSQL
jgi:hypothetical protein